MFQEALGVGQATVLGIKRPLVGTEMGFLVYERR